MPVCLILLFYVVYYYYYYCPLLLSVLRHHFIRYDVIITIIIIIIYHTNLSLLLCIAAFVWFCSVYMPLCIAASLFLFSCMDIAHPMWGEVVWWQKQTHQWGALHLAKACGIIIIYNIYTTYCIGDYHHNRIYICIYTINNNWHNNSNNTILNNIYFTQ